MRYILAVAVLLFSSPAWAEIVTGSSAGGGGGGTITLGTSAAATNPSRSGQVGTGFYSDTTNTVSMAIGSSNILSVNAQGMFLGTPTLTTPGVTLINSKGTSANDVDFIIQNTTTGANSSGSYISCQDGVSGAPASSSNCVWFGINSTIYNQGTTPLNTANSAYLFSGTQLAIATTNSGKHIFLGPNYLTDLELGDTASQVDSILVTGSATGNPGSVTLAAQGSDTNVDFIINAKGNGKIKNSVGGISTTGGLNSETQSTTGMYLGIVSASPRIIWGGSTEWEMDNNGGTLRIFNPAAGLTSLQFNSSGNGTFGGTVAIGTSAQVAGTELTVNGGISQTTVLSCTLGVTTNAAGLFNGCVTSDPSMKDIKGELSVDALATISQLRPIVYSWKDKDRDDREHMGFNSHEVEEIAPDAVTEGGKGLLGVDPNAINALLVRAVQQQQSEIKAVNPGAFAWHHCKVLGIETTMVCADE